MGTTSDRYVAELLEEVRSLEPDELKVFLATLDSWLGARERVKVARETSAPGVGRCPAVATTESGGVQCELPAGHEGQHACPEAIAAHYRRTAFELGRPTRNRPEFASETSETTPKNDPETDPGGSRDPKTG